jgi:hypothetical protein
MPSIWVVSLLGAVVLGFNLGVVAMTLIAAGSHTGQAAPRPAPTNGISFKQREPAMTCEPSEARVFH